MADIAEFLRARLDEDEAAARAMIDLGWPEEVWVTPPQDSDELVPSVAVNEHEPKRYLRVWNDAGRLMTDHGWVVHQTAICVWSHVLAARLLREVVAKREMIKARDGDEPYDTEHFAGATEALRHFAAVYSNHPDYDPMWQF